MNRKKLLKNLLFAQMKGHIFKYICIFLGRKCVFYRVIATCGKYENRREKHFIHFFIVAGYSFFLFCRIFKSDTQAKSEYMRLIQS